MPAARQSSSGRLGWQLDADRVAEDFRLSQFYAPRLGVLDPVFGDKLTRGAGQTRPRACSWPSPIIEGEQDDQLRRGAGRDREDVPPRHRVRVCRFRDGDGSFQRVSGNAPDRTSYGIVRLRSATRTATAGSSRRSPRGCRDGSTRRRRRSRPRSIWPARCAGLRPRMASTRSALARPTRTGRTGTPRYIVPEQAGRDLPGLSRPAVRPGRPATPAGAVAAGPVPGVKQPRFAPRITGRIW